MAVKTFEHHGHHMGMRQMTCRNFPGLWKPGGTTTGSISGCLTKRSMGFLPASGACQRGEFDDWKSITANRLGRFLRRWKIARNYDYHKMMTAWLFAFDVVCFFFLMWSTAWSVVVSKTMPTGIMVDYHVTEASLSKSQWISIVLLKCCILLA